jgi:hypothetical protein
MGEAGAAVSVFDCGLAGAAPIPLCAVIPKWSVPAAQEGHRVRVETHLLRKPGQRSNRRVAAVAVGARR